MVARYHTTFWGIIIQFEVIISTIQIQIRSKHKALDFPDDIIYQGEIYWFPNKTFIELPEVKNWTPPFYFGLKRHGAPHLE
jgi:hypothetical protein